MELRYGVNPTQAAQAAPVEADRWPIRVVNGSPSYVNLLDALNSWQLVRAASSALGLPAAASFKHVSPAGVALAGQVDAATARRYGLGSEIGALTSAYLRARDVDPKSSYGDFAAVSAPVDLELAELLTKVVCDGIIAPGYAPGTVEVLRRKQNGRFLIVEADRDFVPPPVETRDVFGLRLTQEAEQPPLTAALLENPICGDLPSAPARDLLLGLAVLRFTQSNSVCYLKGGMTIGIGVGQQSRVDCTRLAGAKADVWWLRRHPTVRDLPFRSEVRRQDRINWQIRFVEGDLTEAERQRLAAALTEPVPEFTVADRVEWLAGCGGVAFASDGALPFRDNIDHAYRHGVRYVAEPGGSIRSDEVEQACREHGMSLVRTGLRLFHH